MIAEWVTNGIAIGVSAFFAVFIFAAICVLIYGFICVFGAVMHGGYRNESEKENDDTY